jgi:hypothetical protein
VLDHRQQRFVTEANAAQRIRSYLDAAGHAGDLDGPVFRPLSHNRKGQEGRRHMDPDAIDRVLRKHAGAIGMGRGYSAHSMRATFITTALENGATLDDVQRAAGTPSRALPSYTTGAAIIRRSRPVSSLHIKDISSLRGLVHNVFRTGDKADFERMLNDILDRVKIAASITSTQVEHEAAARGTLASSGTPIIMEQRLTPMHESALADAMKLIVQFSERTGIGISDLCEIARPNLAALTEEMTQRMGTAANRINLTQVASKGRERFEHRTDSTLRDVEIGFIQGRSAIVTENSTNQSKALRLLKALYDATRAKTEPVEIDEIETGLSEEDLKVAWHYLKDRGLIRTYNIPYTAAINAAGIDAIEGAQRRPDQPSASFPSVSYNIVNNTMNVGTMSNSPVQQGGVQSAQNQTVSYGPQDIADLNRLVTEFTSHLGELPIGAQQRQKAEAQIATLKAQLTDEPDPVIIKQAGRTLRNITEGAIGSLLATAATQPTVWAWVIQTMHRLFGSGA